jgi:hypothetical protein
MQGTEGPYSDFERLVLFALLILWAVFLFGGFIIGRPNAERTHRTPTWGRMASSLTLVAAAWSSYLSMRLTGLEPFGLLLAVGMSLGCIGDFFMARLIPIKEPVLGGIAAFGLGHVAYITAFVWAGNGFGLDSPTQRWGALAAWLLFGLAGWYVVVFRGQRVTPLHYAALPYALLLSATAGLATGLALQAPLLLSLAVGAALFLFSDLLLAAQLFNNLHFNLIGDAVWLLYGPAQMLIVCWLLAGELLATLR